MNVLEETANNLYLVLPSPVVEDVELQDAELEMVSAGQNVAAGNLVNVQVNNALNNNKIAVDVVALSSGQFTQIQ